MHPSTKHPPISLPREALRAAQLQPPLQAGWTQHLGWKTSTCAAGRGCAHLSFDPESHRRNSNWHGAWCSSVCESRARTQQKCSQRAMRRVQRGTDSVMLLFLAAHSAVLGLAEHTKPVTPSKGRFQVGKGRRKEGVWSLLPKGEAPGEQAEGNQASAAGMAICECSGSLAALLR